MAIGLGGLNLFGVIVLGAMLKYGYLDWIVSSRFLKNLIIFPNSIFEGMLPLNQVDLSNLYQIYFLYFRFGLL